MSDNKNDSVRGVARFRTRTAGHDRYYRAGFRFGKEPVVVTADAQTLQRLRSDPHLVEVLDTVVTSPDVPTVPGVPPGGAGNSPSVAATPTPRKPAKAR